MHYQLCLVWGSTSLALPTKQIFLNNIVNTEHRLELLQDTLFWLLKDGTECRKNIFPTTLSKNIYSEYGSALPK